VSGGEDRHHEICIHKNNGGRTLMAKRRSKTNSGGSCTSTAAGDVPSAMLFFYFNFAMFSAVKPRFFRQIYIVFENQR
jgi:hypothetical protein